MSQAGLVHCNEYVCRTCSFLGEKVQKVKAVIESNAANAVDVIAPVFSYFLAHSACPEAVIRLQFPFHLLRDFHNRISSLPLIPGESHFPGVAVSDWFFFFQ